MDNVGNVVERDLILVDLDQLLVNGRVVEGKQRWEGGDGWFEAVFGVVDWSGGGQGGSGGHDWFFGW